MNNAEIYEEYKNSEYEIKVYKKVGMKCSRQVVNASCKGHIMVGMSSLLQSLVDCDIVTEQELKDMIDLVIETRRKGARNNIIYMNNFKEE